MGGRLRHSLQNVVSGLLYKAVRVIMPFVVRTLIIYKLGADYAGLDSLFTSVLQVLSLAELGFGSAIVFSMYKPVAQGDEALLCRLLNYYKKLYRVIGGVILAAGVCLMPFLPHLIKGDYPPDINLYLLYAIYLLNTVLSYFLFAYKQSLLQAFQRLDRISYIYITAHLCLYAAQIAVLVTVKNYYFYVLLLPASTVMINVLNQIASKRLFPGIRCAGSLEREERVQIGHKAGALIGHKISGVVLNSMNSVVVSAFLGLGTLTVFNNYYYVVSAVSAVLMIIYEAVTASIGNSIVTESVEKNYADFLLISDLNDWLIGWCTVTILCLYQHFMNLWFGPDLMFPAVTMILFTIYFYCNMIRKVVLTYKDAAGMWRADLWKPYVGSATNLILSIILVNVIGVNGVVIASIASMLFISLPWGAWALFKYYFQKSTAQYYRKLSAHSLMTLAGCFGTYYICSLLPPDGILFFGVKGLICVLVPNVLFAAFYSARRELKPILAMARKILRLPGRKPE